MIIQLSEGTAEIFDFITRKIAREYREILFKDLKINQKSNPEDMELNLGNAEMANDSLVMNMLKTLTINNEKKEIKKETMEEMRDEDFNLILGECQKILNKNEADKKKLLNNTEPQ